MMTTNNHNAVNIQDKSKKKLLVEKSSYYSRNSEFFNSFSDDIVDNKNPLRVIDEYLEEFDVKSVIP
jgi:exoribonuclease R